MNKKLPYFYAFVAYFVWGMTFPFSKLVMPPLSALVFVFFRSLMGVIFLIGTLFLTKQFKEWMVCLKQNWWQFALLALIPYCFSYVLQFYAIQLTTSINQSIIGQTSIIWVVVLNFIFFKVKPQFKFIIALSIAMIGVFLLLTTKGFNFSPDTILGDVLSICAFASWASYTVFSKPLSERIKPIFVITSIFAFGTAFLLPIALWQGAFSQLATLSFSQWWILLYLGFVCTGLAYLLHMKSIAPKEVKTEHIAYFSILMPIVATIFSLITSEEQLSWRIAIGGFLVIGSVAILLYKGKNPKT